MTATLKAPPTEEVYGQAKRINLELEKHPLHTHAAIINMLRTMVDHRNVELQNQAQLEQIKAQEAAMADARKAHAERQVKEDARIVEQMSKPPRQVIEIGKREADLPAGIEPKVENVKFNPATDTGVSVEEALKIVTEPTPEYEQVTGG
jgi:hypothetical protein